MLAFLRRKVRLIARSKLESLSCQRRRLPAAVRAAITVAGGLDIPLNNLLQVISMTRSFLPASSVDGGRPYHPVTGPERTASTARGRRSAWIRNSDGEFGPQDRI